MRELELFAAAIAIDDQAERDALLDRECTGRPELRKRLDQLLDQHARSHHLLDRPHGADRSDETTLMPGSALTGTVIANRYKLLEQIGDGGMGTVWMAEQREPVKRLVAVKLIKPGMDSEAVLARFEAERQALALMDHPNIAKVHDAGTDENGRPYFVMELVKGLPLTEYCDARKLTVNERLHLFVQICWAVQHAHQKAVIHRDLKPTNVLVTEHDGKPVPKVIDFGLAKALNSSQMLTDRTLHTAYGMVVGTPLYMAPEQVGINALDVDTRTDIYALGVILYELLTGTTPLEKARFKETTWEEVKRLIREDEPPRPSTRLSSDKTLPTLAASRQVDPGQLRRQVQGELDWIVMKTLDKDRGRRYETATGLAKDVQRYLAGDAVEACPPTLGYRLRKAYRKNRAAVLTTGLFAAVLVIATGVSVVFAVLARRAEVRALHSEDQARALARRVQIALEGESKQRDRAEKTISRVLDLLTPLTTPSTGDALLAQREITNEQKQLFKAAIGYYRDLAEQKGTGVTTRSRIAAAALQAASLADLLGDEQQAIDALLISIREYTNLVGESSQELDYQKQLAACQLMLGNLYGWKRHNPNEGITLLHSARKLYDALAQGAPDTPEYRTGQFECHRGLGVTYFELGRIDDAEREMAEAARIMEMLARDYPANLEYQYGISSALLGQCAVLARSGRRRQARKPFKESMEILQKLVDQPNVKARDRLKYGSAYAVTLHNQGRFFQDAGKLTLAEQSFRQSLEVGERLAGEFPSDPNLQRVLGRTHDSLGITLAAKGNLSEAGLQWETARQIHEISLKTHENTPKIVWELAHTEGCLGRLHRDRMELQQSLELLTSAIKRTNGLKVQEYTMFEGEGALPHFLGERAITCERMQNWKEALRDWDKAIEHCHEFRKLDEAAYRLGRLTTEIQSGDISPEEAITKAESDNLIQDALGSLNRQYLVVRFYAVAAKSCPEGPDNLNQYAEAAIDQLKMIVDNRGPCFIDWHPGNTDFAVLRKYDSFRKLEATIQNRIQDTNTEMIEDSPTRDATDSPGP